MNHSLTGTSLALAVAGLLAASPALAGDKKGAAPAPAPTASVKCEGINSCKGTGACKTATNACAGQNACKGTGWVNVETEKACLDKGGKVVAPPTTPAPAK